MQYKDEERGKDENLNRFGENKENGCLEVMKKGIIREEQEIIKMMRCKHQKMRGDEVMADIEREQERDKLGERSRGKMDEK